MLNNTTEELNPSHFYSYIPNQTKSILCIAISSKDERYKGAFQYNIANVRPGWFQLNFPTKYRKKLDKYRSNEIANSNCIHNLRRMFLW